MLPSLHHTLRASTSEFHDQLDRVIVENSICRSEECLVHYLRNFHEALAVCWKHLDWDILNNLGLDSCDLRKQRYESLTEDLRAWGGVLPDLPVTGPGSAARSAGIAYVLEGSMHGGRALLAKATGHLGEIPADRCRFLEGFGKNTPRRWSDFLNWLGSLPMEPSFQDEACGSAIWAFDNFITSIRPRDHATAQASS